MDVQKLYNGDMQKCCIEGNRKDIYIDPVEMDVEQSNVLGCEKLNVSA